MNEGNTNAFEMHNMPELHLSDEQQNIPHPTKQAETHSSNEDCPLSKFECQIKRTTSLRRWFERTSPNPQRIAEYL